MPIEPTGHQEFDPNDEYEELPFPSNPLQPGLPKQPGVSREEEADCCVCIDGDVTFCASEGSLGYAMTFTVAQGVAFWFSPSC